jgi:hypothetical protein
MLVSRLDCLQDTLAKNVTSLDEHAAVQDDPSDVENAPQVGSGTVRDEDVRGVEGEPRQEVGSGTEEGAYVFMSSVQIASRIDDRGWTYKVFKVEAGNLATFPASCEGGTRLHQPVMLVTRLRRGRGVSPRRRLDSVKDRSSASVFKIKPIEVGSLRTTYRRKRGSRIRSIELPRPY